MKIDMYTLKEYMNGYMDFLKFRRERGILTPLSRRDSKFVTKKMRTFRAPFGKILTLLKYNIKRADLSFHYLFTEITYL